MFFSFFFLAAALKLSLAAAGPNQDGDADTLRPILTTFGGFVEEDATDVGLSSHDWNPDYVCEWDYLAGDYNEWLAVGEYICSENGEYEFGLNPHGNLFMYYKGKYYVKVLGEGNYDRDKNYLIMQSDGNLVAYNSEYKKPKKRKALWSSGTRGKGGEFVHLDNDGYVGIYKDAKWSSKYETHYDFKNPVWKETYIIKDEPTCIGTTLGYQKYLYANEFICKKDHKFGLDKHGYPVYIKDGQVKEILKKGDEENYMKMQSDGNLVVYHEGEPIWASDTNGTHGRYVRIYSKGGVAIKTKKGKRVFKFKKFD